MSGYIVPFLLFLAAGILFYDWREQPDNTSPWFAFWVLTAGIVALIAAMVPLFIGGQVPAIFNTLRLFFDVIVLCVIAIMYISIRF